MNCEETRLAGSEIEAQANTASGIGLIGHNYEERLFFPCEDSGFHRFTRWVGDDLKQIGVYLDGRTTYSAADVLAYLLDGNAGEEVAYTASAQEVL